MAKVFVASSYWHNPGHPPAHGTTASDNHGRGDIPQSGNPLYIISEVPFRLDPLSSDKHFSVGISPLSVKYFFDHEMSSHASFCPSHSGRCHFSTTILS